MDLEAGTVSHSSKLGWKTTLSLAFQSIGIVYGDIGTSPLYVYATTFDSGISNEEDILGVLSIIIYTIILVPMIKYVFIVLWANDNGNGGAFALYSQLCQHAKVSVIPNQQPEDRELIKFSLEAQCGQQNLAQRVKLKLDNSKFAQVMLFLLTITGASMVIGDGMLTPSISVLSAVSGISSLGQGAVVGISMAILVLLFSVQRFGTDKVGFALAPIILVWFSIIGVTGFYNLVKHDLGVLRALNPKCIVDYFKRNGKQGWISLGGILLCVTGSEAMFADLGHFSVRAIQISFSFFTFPALLAAYSGQAAYLRKFPGKVYNAFFESIPVLLYWPTFVVAVAAAVIASQAMISGSFSIISQAISLGCFPRIKVVHTSAKHPGQVYIPWVNCIFMVTCVVISAAFRTPEKISHAYGIAVVWDMLITTSLVSLIMLIIWKTSIWWIALFFLVFGSIEALYLSSVLYKFMQGGFLPLVSALLLMLIMGIWHYVYKQSYMVRNPQIVGIESPVKRTVLHDLYEKEGQSPWYDNLCRPVTNLLPLIACGIRGVTSNLASFQKAMTSSNAYNDQLRELVRSGTDIESAYWELVVKDIQDASKLFKPIYDPSDGGDGFVSVAVSPRLADDTEGTIEAANWLYRMVDRPNVYIQIPATVACIPSIKEIIAQGLSVNVTLVFSLARYEAVIDSYLDGLEASRLSDLSKVTSVASFFLSQVDTFIDKMLEEIGTPEALDLRGKAAVAQAVMAYHLYQKKFSGARWEALVRKGAKKQRLLWASTSGKNPSYHDTLYITPLIGPDTVSTMADQALQAFIDHGTVSRTIDLNTSEAKEIYNAIEKLGIDWNVVGYQLEVDGVKAFKKSFDNLLVTVQEKANSLGLASQWAL